MAVKRLQNSLRRPLIWLLTLLAIACTLPACEFAPQSRSLTSSRVSSKAAVRVVKHAFGETRVPMHPQRVVALSGGFLEDAMALGVKPVAAPNYSVSQLQQLVGPLSGIEDVNWPSPNLEKILALKPDLILGLLTLHKNIYPLLSHIAPTVLAFPGTTGAWKEEFFFTALALGKSDAAQQIVERYYARLAKFKAQMGQHLQNTVVSVAELRAEALVLWAKASFSGVILKDAGVVRPSSQTLDSLATKSRGGGPAAYPLSREFLSEVDGNILFLVSEDTTGKRDLQSVLQQLKAEPLWSKLKVVQQGNVHEVGVHWVQYGLLAANQAIDDLERYLLKQQ